MSKIGFIGLGIMGNPMARNLLTKGSQLLVFDIAEPAVRGLVEAGATSATLQEIGSSCDVIFTILPNGSIVKAALFGEAGVASAIRPGSAVVDMSSVTPAESRYCYDEFKKLGVSFLDAPVSGGEPKAIDGTLAFMAGGDEKTFDRVRPLLMQMGTSALLIGGPGSGSITKLANQIVCNLNVSALCEALVFAAKAGVDPEKVFQAIRGGLAGSVIMEAKAPMILDRNFKPGGKIAINHKDIRNVLNTAHDLDIPVPMSAQLFEVMQALKVRGLMDDDIGAIVKHYELLAGVEVKRAGD